MGDAAAWSPGVARRPPKKGEPFSTEVVFNRISGEWEDVMVNQVH